MAPFHRQLNGLLFLSVFSLILFLRRTHPLTCTYPEYTGVKLINFGILTFEFHKLFYACITFSDIKSLPKNGIHLYERKSWMTTPIPTVNNNAMIPYMNERIFVLKLFFVCFRIRGPIIPNEYLISKRGQMYSNVQNGLTQ